jgi:hypothetical protein
MNFVAQLEEYLRDLGVECRWKELEKCRYRLAYEQTSLCPLLTSELFYFVQNVKLERNIQVSAKKQKSELV